MYLDISSDEFSAAKSIIKVIENTNKRHEEVCLGKGLGLDCHIVVRVPGAFLVTGWDSRDLYMFPYLAADLKKKNRNYEKRNPTK